MSTINLRQFFSIKAIAAASMLALSIGSTTARGQESPPRGAEASESRPHPPEEPSDRPDRSGGDRPGGERREGFDRGMDHEGRGERFDRGRFRSLQLPSDEEWNTTLQFMKDHAPNMSRKIGESKDLSTMAQEGLKSAAFGRYRNLRDLERDNAALYAVRLKVLTASDTLFGLMTELREAEEGKVSDLRQKVRDQTRQMVELSFEERELRLADLERRMNRERELLKQDRDRAEEIVEKRFKAEIGKNPRTESVLPGGEGSGGPGGGGGPPPRGGPSQDRFRGGPDRPRDHQRDPAPAEEKATTQPVAP